MSADRINDGGPAFPEAGLSGLPNGEFVYGQPGMTLRDYFAAKATEDDIRAVMKFGESYGDPCDRATARFRHADAMLKARGGAA